MSLELEMASIIREATNKVLIDQLIYNNTCSRDAILELCKTIQVNIKNHAKVGINMVEETVGENHRYDDIITVCGVFEILGYEVTHTPLHDTGVYRLNISW